jgi:hypothetical protein
MEKLGVNLPAGYPEESNLWFAAPGLGRLKQLLCELQAGVPT